MAPLSVIIELLIIARTLQALLLLSLNNDVMEWKVAFELRHRIYLKTYREKLCSTNFRLVSQSVDFGVELL